MPSLAWLLEAFAIAAGIVALDFAFAVMVGTIIRRIRRR